MLELGPEPRSCTAALGREAGGRLGGRGRRWATSPAPVADGARAAGLAPSGRAVAAVARRRRPRRSRPWTAPGDWILVKASRGMRLSGVVDALATSRGQPKAEVPDALPPVQHRCARRIPGANVFRYVSTRIGLATLTSLLITFVVAPWFIRRARERQLGEVIRDDGPASHASRSGTPTMGGALISWRWSAATLLWCDLRSTLVWLALLVTVGYGAIGFVDDYLKLHARTRRALPGKVKLLGQFVIGGGGDGLAVHRRRAAARVRLRLALPLVNFHHMSAAHRLDHAAARRLRRVRRVRADGGVERRQPHRRPRRPGDRPGDHLLVHASCCSSTRRGTTLRSFNIAEYLGMPHVPGAGELAVFCGAMGGAGIGFLWFNTHPAQVFMGDVGALALGGAIGFVALATKTELSLPIIGGVFVAEAVSDIIQVAYYKRTKKRVFLMAPIHHHFEKLGWPESRIVVRFWIVSFACAILGLITTLKVR